MMYMVVTNQRYMTLIEANSQLAAEHKILDDVYYGVKGCQAFDQKGMATETFAGFMMTCKTVTFEQLKEMATTWQEENDNVDLFDAKAKEYERQIKVKEEELNNLKEDLKICKNNKKQAEIDRMKAWEM